MTITDTTRPALGVDLIYKLGGSQKIDKCTSAGGVIGVTPNVTITLLCGNPRRHSTDKLEANKVNGMFIDVSNPKFGELARKARYRIPVLRLY